MQALMITANYVLKIAAAGLFASDGDFKAALAFIVIAPLSHWCIAN